MTPLLRKATLQDIKAIVDIYNDANLLFDEAYRSPGTESTFHTILSEDQLIMASIEGEDIGFISYKTIGDLLLITGLYVVCRHQQRGIASHLMHSVLKDLSHVSYVVLKVLKSAPWAISFYKKQGFIDLDSESIDFRTYINQYVSSSTHSKIFILKGN